MIVKICGITNRADAAAACENGANAIGFNFYPRSPRFIEPEDAAGIPTPAGVRRVGVFVNEQRARMEEIARIAGLDVAQLHGDEMARDYPESLPVWKAVRMAADLDVELLTAAEAQWDRPPRLPATPARTAPLPQALVLDGPSGEAYGGSGKTFDWALAAWVAGQPRPAIILAGGLDASNVAQAFALVHPWGVDACSRIESAPGRKDHEKMKAFLQAARAALGA